MLPYGHDFRWGKA